MSSVKINDKNILEELSAKIFLKTGRKFTQQELLSLCVSFSLDNLENFVTNIVKGTKIWTDKEIDDLELLIEDLGEGTEKFSSQVDEILYGNSQE
jgi:hypothetical protein